MKYQKIAVLLFSFSLLAGCSEKSVNLIDRNRPLPMTYLIQKDARNNSFTAPDLQVTVEGEPSVCVASINDPNEKNSSDPLLSLTAPVLPALSLDPQPDWWELIIHDSTGVLWQGDPLEIKQAGLHQNGIYHISIQAFWGRDEGSWEEGHYRFAVMVDNPTKLSLSADSIKAGRCVVITARYLPEGECITASTDLGVTPVFYADGDRQTAYLPIKSATQPGDYSLSFSWGQNSQTLPIRVLDGEFEVEVFEVDEEIANETINNNAANEEYEAITRPLKNTGDEVQYWNGKFSIPVQMEPLRTSSSFGYTRLVNGIAERHGGVDFPVPRGTPVTAPNNGRVLYSDYLKLTGNTVCVEHGFGLKSWYYHLDSLSCKTGQVVFTGDELGKVGSTGFSTGPHLHFAMSVNNVYIDPWQFIQQSPP